MLDEKGRSKYPAVFSGPGVQVLCRRGGGVVCEIFASEGFADGGVGCHFDCRLRSIDGCEREEGLSSDRKRLEGGVLKRGELSCRVGGRKQEREERIADYRQVLP